MSIRQNCIKTKNDAFCGPWFIVANMGYTLTHQTAEIHLLISASCQLNSTEQLMKGITGLHASLIRPIGVFECHDAAGHFRYNSESRLFLFRHNRIGLTLAYASQFFTGLH